MLQNKLIIGIDLSQESSGICFRFNGESHYLNILNKFHFTSSRHCKKADEAVEKDDVVSSIINLSNINIDFIERLPLSPPRKIGLTEWGRIHLSNCVKFSDLIYNGMMRVISERFAHIKAVDTIICIENYSYGSATDNLIQIVELTSMLKNKLATRFYDYNTGLSNFFLTTAPTVKMFVGKGNYDKFQMLEAYINNVKEDQKLHNDPLHKTIKHNPSMYWKMSKKKGKEFKDVQTPVGDLIDSYFTALWMEHSYPSLRQK